MEVIRRNTDYAFRLMAALAKDWEKCLPVRRLAQENDVPYQLACKLLQKLASASLVESVLGPKGGYRLALAPGEINLKQIIETIQGPVVFNKCLNGDFDCPLSGKCPIKGYLAELQSDMNKNFESKTLLSLI
jgi:Rrf2 family transcriptional regulator, iron-sulfur cluster assembly transcription factor